jgi:Aminotransferase class-V
MLKKLLFINGLFTAIGGILLIFLPNQLMQIFGIQLPQKDFFIYYLLGVTSISFSVLSFYSMKLQDRTGLKIIAFSFLIFHIAEAVVGIYEFTNGFSFSQDALARILCDKYQILVSEGFHCAHILHHRLRFEGTLRISAHVFTTPEEIESVISALRELTNVYCG